MHGQGLELAGLAGAGFDEAVPGGIVAHGDGDVEGEVAAGERVEQLVPIAVGLGLAVRVRERLEEDLGGDAGRVGFGRGEGEFRVTSGDGEVGFIAIEAGGGRSERDGSAGGCLQELAGELHEGVERGRLVLRSIERIADDLVERVVLPLFELGGVEGPVDSGGVGQILSDELLGGGIGVMPLNMGFYLGTFLAFAEDNVPRFATQSFEKHR